MFSEGGKDRRDKLAEERKKELKSLRQKLMAGTKDNLMDQFDDLLNASANKVKKTKVRILLCISCQFNTFCMVWSLLGYWDSNPKLLLS